MSNTGDIAQSGAERRRTERMLIPFRIEVCGREPKGATFQDETTTIDVNEHGCKFDLSHPINRGDLVTIRHLTADQNSADENSRMLFQIVWAEACETGWTVGAMKLQEKSAWPITFPAKSASKRASLTPS